MLCAAVRLRRTGNDSRSGRRNPVGRRFASAALAACLAAGLSGCREAQEPTQSPEVSGQALQPVSPPALPFVITAESSRDEVQAPRSIRFAEVAAERGVIFEWPQQPRPMTALDAFGAGCAAFDADNDGWQDILLVGTPLPALFCNERDGRFRDVTRDSGLGAVSGHWTGSTAGDFNGDGLLDLLLTGYHQLALFENQGEFRFREVTELAGLDRANQGYWASTAGFMDLDGDSWLDLVIVNYVIYGPETQKYCEYAPGVVSGCNPKIYPPEQGQIWRNTGKGKFTLVPPERGMEQVHGIGLVLAFTDLDDDGLMDFYVGNDGIPADLMHNQGNMRFENIAPIAGVAVSDGGSAVSSMGADWADFNRDGLLDLAVSNWQGEGFVLFQGLGSRLFSDCAKRTGLSRQTRNRLGFGAKWIDFDNDAWPDLFFVNGHVYDNSADIHGPEVPFRQPLSLFWNDRGRRFVDIVPDQAAELRRPMVGRGSATADFNNDGRVDLLAVDFEGPPLLLENRSETGHHWLTLDLRGKAPNRFAYGARLTGTAGSQTWVAEVSPASSYLSSSDPRIHWGLGEHTALQSLTIRWPSGATQVLHDIPANQILPLVEE